MDKPKENPSFTKKHGGDDVRKNHKGADHADYSKFDREHPHKNTGPGAGYKGVGKPSKQGGDDVRKSHPHADKADYSKFERKHPHQGK